MDLKKLYQDIILEHGKSPRNFGKCKKYTHEAKGYNPLCGDQVQVYVKMNELKRVEDLSFEGSGCAISIASTSIMTELIKGKSIETTKKIIVDFLNILKNTQEIKSDYLNDDQKTKIMSLSEVKQYPMRVKCATLSWHTLSSALENSQEIVKTEK